MNQPVNVMAMAQAMTAMAAQMTQQSSQQDVIPGLMLCGNVEQQRRNDAVAPKQTGLENGAAEVDADPPGETPPAQLDAPPPSAAVAPRNSPESAAMELFAAVQKRVPKKSNENNGPAQKPKRKEAQTEGSQQKKWPTMPSGNQQVT